MKPAKVVIIINVDAFISSSKQARCIETQNHNAHWSDALQQCELSINPVHNFCSFLFLMPSLSTKRRRNLHNANTRTIQNSKMHFTAVSQICTYQNSFPRCSSLFGYKNLRYIFPATSVVIHTPPAIPSKTNKYASSLSIRCFYFPSVSCNSSEKFSFPFPTLSPRNVKRSEQRIM